MMAANDSITLDGKRKYAGRTREGRRVDFGTPERHAKGDLEPRGDGDVISGVEVKKSTIIPVAALWEAGTLSEIEYDICVDWYRDWVTIQKEFGGNIQAMDLSKEHGHGGRWADYEVDAYDRCKDAWELLTKERGRMCRDVTRGVVLDERSIRHMANVFSQRRAKVRTQLKMGIETLGKVYH